jgi:hypothetical protein
MIILCDTCSILMVVRIAPDMFIDERFGCSTIPKVHDEIFRTQKFKTKYPWRDEYKSKIKTVGSGLIESDEFKMNLSIIHNLVEAGIENSETGLLVDLSLTDKHIIACAAVNQYDISSGDRNLVNFADQQFEITNIAPLTLVNQWLEEELIVWDDHLQMIMEDWERCGEMEQPIKEIGRFQALTKFRYVGS